MRSQRAILKVNHRRNLKRNLQALDARDWPQDQKDAMRLIYTAELEKVETNDDFLPKTIA